MSWALLLITLAIYAGSAAGVAISLDLASDANDRGQRVVGWTLALAFTGVAVWLTLVLVSA